MGSAQLITRFGDNTAGLSKEALAELNRVYGPLSFEERIARVFEDFPPERIMVTSSFAATSAYFLHIISSIRPEQPVHFIDTGYHFEETLKLDDSPPRTKLVITVGNHNGRAQEFSISHLAGNKLAPDQVVELLSIFLQAAYIGWPTTHIGRTDGLVGLLGALFATVYPWFLRQEFITELLFDKFAATAHGVLAQVGRVGTHVGNEAGFIEALGQHHGFLDAEPHPVAGRLLQRGRNKGGGGT